MNKIRESEFISGVSGKEENYTDQENQMIKSILSGFDIQYSNKSIRVKFPILKETKKRIEINIHRCKDEYYYSYVVEVHTYEVTMNLPSDIHSRAISDMLKNYQQQIDLPAMGAQPELLDMAQHAADLNPDMYYQIHEDIQNDQECRAPAYKSHFVIDQRDEFYDFLRMIKYVSQFERPIDKLVSLIQ